MSDERSQNEVRSGSRWGEWSALVSAIGVLASVVVLGWQVYHWLRFGFWQSVTNQDLVIWLGSYPDYFEWAGVQKIWEWLLNQSFGLTLFVASVALIWISDQTE